MTKCEVSALTFALEKNDIQIHPQFYLLGFHKVPHIQSEINHNSLHIFTFPLLIKFLPVDDMKVCFTHSALTSST